MNTFVPDEMKLGNKESVLVGVDSTREIQVINVNGLASTFSFSGNNQIEFTWTSSESIDLTNSYFEADLKFLLANGAPDTLAKMNNFADMVDRVEFYVDSQQIFSSTSREISVVQNILLMNEGSRNYFENEGKVHLGYNNQKINNFVGAGELTKFDPSVPYAGANEPDRKTNALNHLHHATPAGRGLLGSVSGAASTRIHIPLFSLHLALGSMDGNLPVLGSQLRMVFHLNDPKRCMAICDATGGNYSLTQCRLYVQEVVLSADYKSALLEQVSSAEGLSIHYYDVDVIQTAPSSNATSHQLIIRNDHSNAKSLYFFDVDGGASIPTAPILDTTRMAFPSMRSRMGVISTEVRVECGNKLITGIAGSVGTMSHYNHLLRCAGHLSDISPMGSFSDSYCKVGGGTSAINQDLVFSPLGFNLEKSTLKDTDTTILNSGLSSSDVFASRDINVKIDTGAVSWDPNWRLFAVLLHSKTMVFSNKSISIVD